MKHLDTQPLQTTDPQNTGRSSGTDETIALQLSVVNLRLDLQVDLQLTL
jgi:hypothetical protein